MAIDPIEAAMITALYETLAHELTGEEGECPWCGAIRAAVGRRDQGRSPGGVSLAAARARLSRLDG